MHDFICAIKNEIEVEKLVLQLAHLKLSQVGYIPRVAKWIKYAKIAPKITLTIWFIFKTFWLAGGSSIFFLLQLCDALLFKRCGSSNSIITASDDGFIIALSSRVNYIVNSSNFTNLPKTWITVPWVALRYVPNNAICLDVFSLISRADLWYAFRNAVTSTYIISNHKHTSKWVLQNYTAFRWFAVRAAVDKLPGRLVMADHFDRWAVLVDSSVHTQKFAVVPSGDLRKRELLLIQHGFLGSLVEESSDSAPKLRLYRKLRAVTHLYAYGVEAEHAFKSDVLSAGCVSRGLDVSFFKPSILLTEDENFTGLKLLFVGHPLCEELHKHIFCVLRDKYDFSAYYKPHPRAPMSKSMRQLGWSIIDNPSMFPAVDLLISYQSTLVVEYAGEGVPAAVHAINLEKEKSYDFLASVVEKINTINYD